MHTYTGNIFLIGFMGCGKSAVSKALSNILGADILEMDEMIACQEGMSIPEIFEQKGEAYFRRCETKFLEELDGKAGKIVSCGGGVATILDNVSLMKEKGRIVLLKASPKTILNRVRKDKNRPLLKDKKNVQAISQLMEARKAMYEAAAHIQVDTDDRTTEEIAEEILSRVMV